MRMIKTLSRLWTLYARMDLHWFISDMRNCILVIFCDFISAVAGISGILVLSVRFGGVGGFSADEVLYMLGFFTMGEGLMNMCFNFNIDNISRRIGRGQLDHMLIQPRPLWMQLITEGFIPVSGNSVFLCGIVVTLIACARMGMPFQPLHALCVALYLFARIVMMLSLSYIAATGAFYAPAAMEEISGAVFSLVSGAGKYPLSGLPRALMIVLSTLIPVSLSAYLPAVLLLGKADSAWLAVWPFALSAGFAAVAARAFRRGLTHYGKTGSVRYRAIGHRR